MTELIYGPIKKMRKNIFLIASLLIYFAAGAQTVQEVQYNISNYINRINEVGSDSLHSINQDFFNYLQEACTNNISVLKANFVLPRYSHMGIITSGDDNVRIFYWDTEEGGTMRAYNAILQYFDGKSTKTKKLNNIAIDTEEDGQIAYGSYYDTIYTVRRNNGKTIYLIVSGGITGVEDHPESIQAISIDKGIYEDTLGAFVTPKKKYSRIDIDYGWSGFDKETIHLISNKLYIPIINGLKYTGKFLVYVFDGNNFVFHKNAK